jgi:blue copper oxidase
MARVTRRTVLGAGAAVAAGVAGGWWWRTRLHEHAGHMEHAAHVDLPMPLDEAFPNALRLPGTDGLFGILDAPQSFTLTAKPSMHPVLPGKPARVLGYEAEYHGQRYLNPLLRARTGTALRIRLWNALDETSIIHWHGFKVDSNNDGHPHYAVAGGATYDYNFGIANRAATYWYHPHPHHLTGKQVYHGLAGLFIVEDDEELALQRALDLKLGETDIPLVIQDRRFDPEGGLVYAPSRDDRFHGFYGGEMLVNWTPKPYFDAATRIFRFRILNGSNARLYRVAFRHGEHLLDYHVIGTDGGLLDQPRMVKEAFLAPAERLDVLLDLRAVPVGESLTLVSLAFDPMHAETSAGGKSVPAGHGQHHAHGDHAAHRGYLPDGAEVELLRIRVRRTVAYDRSVPQALSRIEPPASAEKPRVIALDQSRMRWRINGATYDHNATPIVVKRGSAEVWEVRNAARSMPHPMHIHGFQFRILSREGSPEQVQRLAVDASGLAPTDLGWKDTVLSWPGETVRIVTDFSHPFLGDQVYMVHCHNLEHEDGGMMLNLKVAT